MQSAASPLKNFREIGHFDLVVTPLTPIKTVNSQALHFLLGEMLEKGHKRIVIDLTTVTFIYSDTLSVLSRNLELFKLNNANLGVLTDDIHVVSTLKMAHLDQILLLFSSELEILNYRPENVDLMVDQVPQNAVPEIKPEEKKSKLTGLSEVDVHNLLGAKEKKSPKKRKKAKKALAPYKKPNPKAFLFKLLLIPVVSILILFAVLTLWKPQLLHAILSTSISAGI